jgi:hypothetical protein
VRQRPDAETREGCDHTWKPGYVAGQEFCTKCDTWRATKRPPPLSPEVRQDRAEERDRGILNDPLHFDGDGAV